MLIMPNPYRLTTGIILLDAKFIDITDPIKMTTFESAIFRRKFNKNENMNLNHKNEVNQGDMENDVKQRNSKK
jgi:hypothetical protein